MSLLSVLVPIVVAILAGGGVAFYTARPQKDSIIASASKNAVEVVNQAIERLEADNVKLRNRVTALERDREVAARHVRKLNEAIVELGGTVDDSFDSEYTDA